MRVLIVGASGYIGGRLVPRLAAQGHEFILTSRTAWPFAARFPQATGVVADLLDPSTLPMALEMVEVAYYRLWVEDLLLDDLVHGQLALDRGEQPFAGLDPAFSRRLELGQQSLDLVGGPC
jgi:nucleoside-diphosphate-sugar epimerase